MDGGLITAMRTGAATGVSVKYLARKNSKVMSIYSAGVQAKKQVSGVYYGLDQKLEKCKVFDLKKESAKIFKSEIEKELGIEVEISESSDDLLLNTDIIVAATTSTTPIFSGDKVPEGVHISSIGAHAPDARELDTTTIKKASLLVAGLKEACIAEAGDYIIPINEGVISESDIVSIGNIITGKISSRSSDTEITVFKSVGISAQDVAVGKLVYDRALKEGIGQDIDF
jgi:ornithine cyclodeaminase